MTSSRVGEIDDPEVDLAAFTWPRIVTTFGNRPNHEILAVGSTKRDRVWRAWEIILSQFLTLSVRGLLSPQGRSVGILSGRGTGQVPLMVLPLQ